MDRLRLLGLTLSGLAEAVNQRGVGGFLNISAAGRFQVAWNGIDKERIGVMAMIEGIKRGLGVAGFWLWAGAAVGTAWGPGPARASDAADIVRQLNQAFIEVADKVSPSVVVVSVAHRSDFAMAEDDSNPLWEWLPPQFRDQFRERFRRENRGRRNQPPVFDGQGSGVVIREDGYILTNRHVVEGAEKIRVRFKSGKEYDAEIRGVDAQSDIAVLKISAEGLPVARLADSDKVRVGEFAVAIGAPFDLDYSVTVGHVSAKGRSQVIPDPSMDQDFIQTDASINPSNSGGPLVNIDDEVIGVNTLIRGLRTGIGFAIPSNLAREVSDKLIAEGKFSRSWLGLEIRALSQDPEMRELAKGVDDGVVVRGIVTDGPAAKSDLRLGDVITAVEGRQVNTAQQLRNEVRTKPIGSTVVLDVVRNGKSIKIKVKPEEWPEDQATAATARPRSNAEASEDLGITIQPLTQDLAKEHGIEVTEGLLVTDVAEDGLAGRKGVQRGDVLTEVNQRPVKTLREYREALRESDLKKGVLLNLVREGVSRLVVLKDTGE